MEFIFLIEYAHAFVKFDLHFVVFMNLGLTQVVTPGQRVLQLPENGVIRIGTGLYDDGTFLVSSRAGILHQTSGNRSKFWIDSNHRRYFPSPGDAVLGIILSKGSEYYEVDIKCPFSALLPVLAFEGVTRRNRPILKEGDLVYCMVESAYRDIQPTVICTDASGRASGFGHLKGGMLVECANSTCQSLLSRPMPAYLATLGRELKFELAIGMNGRVWVNAADLTTIVTVSKVLRACDRKTDGERLRIVKDFLNDVR